MTVTDTALGCPQCRSTCLDTVERIPGRARTDGITRKPDGTLDIAWGDGTTVDWDNSTTVGVVCRDCGWTVTADDWADRLAPLDRPATMAVRVPDRRHDPVGHATVRTITIPTTCPVCGGPRGETREHRFNDDGDWKTVDRWDNPCGHVDVYDVVLAAHEAAAAVTA